MIIVNKIVNLDKMEFLTLQSEEQLAKIAEADGTNIIFKHNTTCPISRSVKQKLEQEADQLPQNAPFYILDLLANRNISDSIADTFNVTHESPQLLLIKNGKCIYHESLYNISAEETKRALDSADN
jgi:bacillithiol system protein YtxJ